jgi:ADP-heptose:LPS heptosyltransferase
MNVSSMRRIDRWLGTPVCFLLTCWRRCFSRCPPELSWQPRRLLFIKLAEKGSTVLAQGAIRAAISRVGSANVFFLLFAENRPILDLLDLIPPENVIAIRTRGLVGTFLGACKAVFRLRRIGIDAAIDMEFFARSSAALCYLSGARWRVGYHAFGGEASYRGDLMTHRLSFNSYLHTAQTFRIMVEALDHPADQFPRFKLTPPPPDPGGTWFSPSEEEIAAVQSLLRERLGPLPFSPCRITGTVPLKPRGQSPFSGRDGRRLLVLNANASDLMPLRRWPGDRYVELAQRLLARYPMAAIVFTGAPSEVPAVEKLVGRVASPRCISLAGETTLRQLLVLYGLAEILVTNDSGPAHFATLTSVDVVVLFGPKTPRLFAAPSPRTHPLWAGLACSPCLNAFNDRNSSYRDNACLQHITVDDVFAQVCHLYEARQDTDPEVLPFCA